jgi:hypothetical protein
MKWRQAIGWVRQEGVLPRQEKGLSWLPWQEKWWRQAAVGSWRQNFLPQQRVGWEVVVLAWVW